MTPLSAFLSYVLPHAPSAPDMLAEKSLRNATIEFCRATRAWRHVAEIAIAGEAQNTITVPSQSELFEIEAAWFKLAGNQYGDPLDRIAYSDANPNLLPTGATPATGAIPSAITQAGFNSVIVMPAAAGTLRASVFLSPTIDAAEVPDFLFSRYATIIADGALSQILITPDQPYTNPDLAVMRGGMFRSSCDKLFNVSKRGQQRAAARTRASFM